MKVTKDDVSKVLAAIQKLVGQEVLIGIPASSASREGGGPLNNAQIGYIHEYGSPQANIPARPFLEPGVSEAMDKITPRMKAAAKAAMDGDSSRVDQQLNAAGLLGRASAKKKIDSGEFEPLKPATVRNRRRARKTQSMRADEKKYLALIAAGETSEAAQDATGIRPLHNTGELGDHITHVVRRKGRS